MRLRNIPHAEGVIQMHRTVIKRPEDHGSLTVEY